MHRQRPSTLVEMSADMRIRQMWTFRSSMDLHMQAWLQIKRRPRKLWIYSWNVKLFTLRENNFIYESIQNPSDKKSDGHIIGSKFYFLLPKNLDTLAERTFSPDAHIKRYKYRFRKAIHSMITLKISLYSQSSGVLTYTTNWELLLMYEHG